MADAYTGEIRLFAGAFAPRNWAFCDGSILPIQSNTPLFSVISTRYGGDGRQTFALPNLRGRAPLHPGDAPGLTPRSLAEAGGVASVALTPSQMPVHTHQVRADSKALSQTDPSNATWASAPRAQSANYAASANTTMNPSALAATGGNQAHNNMQPYLAVTYIICLSGYYPAPD